MPTTSTTYTLQAATPYALPPAWGVGLDGRASSAPRKNEKSFSGRAAAISRFSSVKNTDNLIFSKRPVDHQKPERSTMPENEDVAPAAEAQQVATQASDAAAEAAAPPSANDELSMDQLETLSGGWANRALEVGMLQAQREASMYGTQADWGQPLKPGEAQKMFSPHTKT